MVTFLSFSWDPQFQIILALGTELEGGATRTLIWEKRFKMLGPFTSEELEDRIHGWMAKMETNLH